jgi:acyl-CoA dehydrogenase
MTMTIDPTTSAGSTTALSQPLSDYVTAVRNWSRDHVRPAARAADERHGPPDNWREILDRCPVPLKRHDRFDLPHPPRFEDGRWVAELAITEALCYGDIWVNDVIGQGIGHLTVKLMGTPEQIERWYRPIVDRGGVAAFALTEPHFGSDTSMVATTATRDGESWVINGSKMYCSGGAHADYTIVFASTDKAAGPAAIAAFIVPKGTPGFIIAKANEEKLGIRSWQTSELLFDGCAIPLDHRLGWTGGGEADGRGAGGSASGPSTRSGRSGALGALAQNKPNISAMGLGITQAAIDVATEFLNHTRAEFSARRWAVIEEDLIRMNASLERVRRINWGAQRLLDLGLPNKTEASVSKAYGPPTFEKIIRRCLQLVGPNGASHDLLLEKWYRDVKILDIFEGSAQVQRIIIGRTLMGADAGRG